MTLSFLSGGMNYTPAVILVTSLLVTCVVSWAVASHHEVVQRCYDVRVKVTTLSKLYKPTRTFKSACKP